MPDHRRVEEGGRFERVFLGEVGADEQLPALAERLVGEQVFADLFEAVQEELARALMALAELAHDVLEKRLDLRLRQRRNASDDLLHSSFGGRLEWSDHDAGIGRL